MFIYNHRNFTELLCKDYLVLTPVQTAGTCPILDCLLVANIEE